MRGTIENSIMELLNNTDIPLNHRQFLVKAISILRRDERIAGIAVAGSLAEGGADAFSDVDLVVAVEPEFHGAVMNERRDIAAMLGRLVASFTGEHVGEPRLLVSGVRRLEEKAPELTKALTATLANHDRGSLWDALESTVALYQRLRDEQPDEIERRTDAEEAVTRILKELRERV